MARLLRLVCLTILGFALILISQAGLAQIAQARLKPARSGYDRAAPDNPNQAAQTGPVTGSVEGDVEAQEDDDFLYYFPLIFKSFDSSQPRVRYVATHGVDFFNNCADSRQSLC